IRLSGLTVNFPYHTKSTSIRLEDVIMSYRSRIIHILAGTTLAISSPALAQDLQEVILVVPNPSAILIQPVAAAMDQGFFADEGLRVRVEAVNGSGPLIQALAAGQA